MRVKYSKQAAKYLNTLDRTTQTRIRRGIEGLPIWGDIRPLAGKKDEYRLRIGKLRVIYQQKGDTIRVTTIYPRGQVYKRV